MFEKFVLYGISVNSLKAQVLHVFDMTFLRSELTVKEM